MSKRKKRGATGSELHPRVLISGYYGFDNLGDELILQVLVDELKSRDIKITVLSANPQKTAEKYGVDAIHRTSVIDIIDALTQANLFISGGGGLFQDATGPMSAFYYGGLIYLARFFEVPVCCWAQGVGPLKSNLPRKMTGAALGKCEAITVRDEKSAALVESLSGIEPEVTADPVWLLKLPKKKKASGRLSKTAVNSEPWRVGISLRPWPELTPSRMKALAACLKELSGQVGRPVEFMLLPFQKKEDTHLLEQFAADLIALQAGQTVMADPQTLIEQLGTCDVIFGMRFHSLILGILSEIPVYGLVYDPKVASLLEMFELKGTPVSELDTLNGQTVRAFLDDYPGIDLKYLKRQSRRNFTILNRLLDLPDAELVL